MLGFHLVLVTPHGQYTIKIEQDHRIGDTNYNVKCRATSQAFTSSSHTLVCLCFQ